MALGSSGRVFAERYRVLRRLGAGGMATVYLAEDERLGRQVAVKRLHAESPDDVIKRFAREARLGASLNHASIVQVYDTVPDEESVLIVMEYVEGGTLRDPLADGPLEPGPALELLCGVAAALDEAHAHGVVHRDVKPANILVTPDGDAKLADLGIATAAERTQITRSGTVLGTAAYMAPERLDGKPGDSAVDVYALAAVAFEALSGRKAISGKTAMEVAQRVVAQPPPDLSEFVPGTPPAAAAAICRGLAKDPAERPASAGELVRELTQAYAGSVEKRAEPAVAPPAPAPVAAPPEPAAPPPRQPPPSRQPTPSKRRAGWVLPAAIAAIAAVALFGVLSFTGDDGEPAKPEAGNARTNTEQAATSEQQPPSTTPEAQSPGNNSQRASAVPTTGPVSSPEAAVEAFYTRAAADKYDEAWALAAPGLRSQLGGYNGFKGTFGTLESIELSKVKANKDGKVSFQSVATHTDHVDRCKGTADAVQSGQSWLVGHIGVSCKSS